MITAYVGEIRMFGFDFIPFPWAPCDGRLLPISNYQALFSLLGATYGGDGKTTFAVPDLRGMVEPLKALTFCISMEGPYPSKDGGDVGAVQYVGEIRMFGFNAAPGNWASCDGRILSIGEHTALFGLIGTTFGGNGSTNFALPDLRAMAAPFKLLTFGIAMDGTWPPRDEPVRGSSGDTYTGTYVGEVCMFGFDFAPAGYASCDGRTLPIDLRMKPEYDRYQVLFMVLGTRFGGNGQTDVGVPDLRGRAAPLDSLTFGIAAEYLTGLVPEKPTGP